MWVSIALGEERRCEPLGEHLIPLPSATLCHAALSDQDNNTKGL